MDKAALLKAISAGGSSPKLGKSSNKSPEIIDGKEVVVSTVVKRYYDGVMKKYREYTFKDGSTKQVFLGEEDKPAYVKEQEEGSYRLSPARYVNGRWVAQEPAEEDTSGGASSVARVFKMVNYNVWFSALNQRERALALIDTVQQQDPDVMCFQEATKAFLDILKENDWIQQHYALSDISGNSFRGSQLQYGTLTLVRNTAMQVDMRIFQLPSNMNRRPIALDFAWGEIKIRVVNMHLESMADRKLRKEQYERCFEILQSSDSADLWIFTGDFNFDPERTSAERENLPPGFADAWLKKHGNSAGAFTYPADKTRIDRVLFKSNVYQVDHMQVIGKDPVVVIPGPRTPLNDFEGVLDANTVAATKRPSDHYGLFTVFKLKDS